MSFQTIVVGVDLSPSSDVAITQAMSLARRAGARIVLVYAGIVPEPVGDADYGRALRATFADDRARLEAVRQRLVGQGVEVSHVVINGFPDTALADAGRELGADLITVGSHGRTGLDRFLLGSVAERTVRLASSSVIVCRGAAADSGGFRRIVVGTDFSSLADAALARALEVAAPDAHIDILHAWQPPPIVATESLVDYSDLSADLDASAHQHGRALVERWRARMPTATVKLVIGEAPAQRALVDHAANTHAELVVVGSHGLRGLRRWILGSVAEVVVRHAGCSVLVARAPVEPASASPQRA